MVKLKKYETVQKKKAKSPMDRLIGNGEPTGVACTEKWCKGEMLYFKPDQPHPELKGLKRAWCVWCGWRGWV